MALFKAKGGSFKEAEMLIFRWKRSMGISSARDRKGI